MRHRAGLLGTPAGTDLCSYVNRMGEQLVVGQMAVIPYSTCSPQAESSPLSYQCCGLEYTGRYSWVWCYKQT